MKSVSTIDNIIADRFFGKGDGKTSVYVVAVPSADFTVKSVRVFADKNMATTYMNSLYQVGEFPDLFEANIE